MKLRLCRLLAIAAFVSCFLGSGQSLAQNAYITNDGSGNVSVIDTATNTVTAAIPVGAAPFAVAVSSEGGTVYVANAGFGANTVSAIATATNRVTATIPVGSEPGGMAVTPDGSKVYVAVIALLEVGEGGELAGRGVVRRAFGDGQRGHVRGGGGVVASR